MEERVASSCMIYIYDININVPPGRDLETREIWLVGGLYRYIYISLSLSLSLFFVFYIYKSIHRVIHLLEIIDASSFEDSFCLEELHMSEKKATSSIAPRRKSIRKKKKTIKGHNAMETKVVVAKESKRKRKKSVDVDASLFNEDASNMIIKSLSNDFDSFAAENAAHMLRKERGGYRCAKCGQPKKGHLCPFRTRYAEMGVQCDLKITAPRKRFRKRIYAGEKN